MRRIFSINFSKLFFLIPFILLTGIIQTQAQTPGVIFQKASSTGTAILDPNGDGYVSRNNSGFTGGNDMSTFSEIPYRFLPQMPAPGGPEPLADLVTGSNGGHTDLANIPLAMYFKSNPAAPNDYKTQYLQFRVRLAGNSTASKGYSFLIDTDGLFNQRKLANGTVIEYATPSKVKNLGFEYEVVLALNFDVLVYRHNGSGDDGDPITSNVIWRGSLNGGYSQYFQKSVAASTAGGNADYFFDYYVPLSAFSADGSTGITPTTEMRISGSTVTSAQGGLEGTISDVGGVDDRYYGNDKTKIWKDVIPNFPPTSPNNIASGEFCTNTPSAPTITSTITPNSTYSGNTLTYSSRTISGTSTALAGSTVTIYKNGSAIGTTTVTTSGGSPAWTFTSSSGTTGTPFLTGDVITSKVTVAAAGNCTAKTLAASASVTVSTGAIRCTTPPAPLTSIAFNSGTKTATITVTITSTANQTYQAIASDLNNNAFNSFDNQIKIYLDGTFYPGTVGVGTLTSSTTNTGTYTFPFTPTACAANSQFAFGYNCSGASQYGTVNGTITIEGCESKRTAPIYMNGNTTGTTPTAGTTATATYATTTICAANTSFTGSAPANALIYLYINEFPANKDGSGNIIPATTTNASGSWTVNLSGYSFALNDIITFKAKEPSNTSPYSTGSGGSGFKGLSAPSANVTYTACATVAPTITGTYCPTSTTVTGTSGEAVGTNIIIYRQSDNLVIGTATVVSGGTFSATVKGEVILAAGNVLFATAQATNKSVSANSSTVTVGSQTTANSLGLTLNSPITQGASSISGTTTTSGTIFLYIDGVKTSESVTVTHSGGSTPTPWTINLSSSTRLNISPGVTVAASILVSGTCESQKTSTVIVSCSAPSSSPTLSMTSTAVCSGSKATISIANSQDAILYQVYANGVVSGSSAVGTGGTITVQSGALTAATTLTVRAIRPGTTGTSSCETTLNGSFSITITPAPSAFAVSPATVGICNGTGTTLTLAGSQTGVTYQLYRYDATTDTYAIVPNGTQSATNAPTVSGTGSAITLTTPLLTSTTTFKVVGTGSAPTSCPSDMSNTVTITVADKTITVTPTNQAVCSNTTATVTIANSQIGITYQLFNTTLNGISGSSIAGNGGTITLTSAALTSTATFRVDASLTSPGSAGSCTTALNTTFTVNVLASVTTPTINTGSPTSSSVCVGGTATIQITNAQAGVTYQIYNNTLFENRGTTFTATTNGNLSLTFTPTVAGTNSYSIIATSNCGTATSSPINITVNSPTVFTVSPSNVVACFNSSVTVSLSGSTVGTTYQLFKFNTTTNAWEAIPSGTTSATQTPTVAGTGSAINLITPLLTANTLFKVVGTASGCSVDMSGTVFVTIPNNGLTITPTASTVCTNATTTVTVQSSQVGVSYQIFTPGGLASGSEVAGTGNDIILTSGPITTGGTYTISAIVPNCANRTLTNNFSITLDNSTPIVYTATPSNQTICSNNVASITLSGSQTGVSYQIFQSINNGTFTATGNSVTGTGESITLNTAALTSNATLKVVATKTGCNLTADMSGTSTVTVNAPPTVVSISPTSQSICSGGTASITLLSQSGISYQIYNTTLGANSGSPVTGNGNTITLTSDALTANATLKVIATRSGCTSVDMNGTSTVTINPLPSAPSITINNTSVCSGSSATISVTSPTNGLVYKLYQGGSYTGTSVTAANGAATFSVNATGTYTVTVTSAATCESPASGSVSLTVNPTPATPTITISQSAVCGSGSATVTVTNPVAGQTYQLYKGGVIESGQSVNYSNGTLTFTVSATGSYTVIATNNSTTCTSATSNAVSFTVNPTPATPTITISQSAVCGSGSATVTVTNPVAGQTYQLYKGGVIESGQSVNYSNGTLTFTVSATGSYTVIATNNSTTCTSATSNAVSFTVNPTPATPTITISQSAVCGSGSATVTVTNPVAGQTYQLYKGGVIESGQSVNYSNGTLTFTVSATGSYTVIATNNSTTCTSATSNAVSFTVNPTPATPTITISQSAVCGSGSATVTVTNPVAGQTYQLYKGGVIESGQSVNYSNGTLTFTVSATGSYTVIATNNSTTCTSATSNAVSFTVNPTPATPTITISQSAVCGSGSATVTVTNPVAGQTYQLYKGGVIESGQSVNYSNGTLTFTVSATGSYTVIATNNSTTCTSATSNAVSFTVNPTPATPTITISQSAVCGSGSATVTVTNPVAGQTYQLYKGGVIESGQSVNYSNGTLTFTVSATGSYTVIATNNSTTCTSATSNAVSFTVNPTPATPTITISQSAVCGSGSATVTVTNPVAGQTYQLYKGGVIESGQSVNYSNGTLTFTVSATGSYTVIATNNSTTCTSATSNAVSFTVNPTPATPTITISQSAVCGSGSATVTVTNPVAGQTYQLYKGGVIESGQSVNYSNGTLTFTVSATGSYTVIATNNSTTCTSATSNAVSFTVNSIPTTPTITLNNSFICEGSTTTISVINPTNGFIYKLYKGNVYSAQVTAANGSASFSVNATGTYNVIAENGGCESTSSNSVTLTVNESPTVYNLTSSSQTICNGGTAQVSLSGSEIGVSYQIFESANGGAYTATGNAVNGTGGTLTLTTGNLTVDVTLKVVASISGCSPVDMAGTFMANVEAAPAVKSITSPTPQTICNNSKASITLESSEAGVVYQLFNTTTNPFTASGSPVTGNGSQITLFTDALVSGTNMANSTFTFKVVGTLPGCGAQTDMTGTTTVTVVSCPDVTYAVELPFRRSSYIFQEIIATPTIKNWNFIGPLEYTLEELSEPGYMLLNGTDLSSSTGQIYVSTMDMTTLQPGTRNLKIKILDKGDSDPKTNSRFSYMTYSINDDSNDEGNNRSSLTTLPVTLLYFNAKSVNGVTNLAWATSFEDNNEYFEIERSTDAKTFVKIGQIKGAGNSTTILKYSYSDSKPASGTNYYRLKQVDLDGKFEFSPIIVVSSKGLAAKLVTESLITYPNPTTGKLTLVIDTPDNYTVEIRNILGKIVFSKAVTVNAQTPEIEADLTNLANGTYIITVTSKNRQFITRVVKN